ncbi:hypothetical protein CRM22_010353 [Opisthorchis felineus]|uniref:Uncharacterized protein n=1 Tax=Opisthorchis felineus TaxID=147828 RepID=A0A4S2KZL6_OPIFE|nr:hypothetical protein CRM22_010353 [Opisthorchis felineus]
MTVFGFTVKLKSFTTGSWVDYFKAWGLTRFSNYDLCNGMRQVAEKASKFHELQLAFCRTHLTSVREMEPFDELRLYFLTSSLRANRVSCSSRLALELQNIFNIRPVGSIHSSKVTVQAADALLVKETMLQKRGKSGDADTVWEEDRSFQLALHNAFPRSEKPIAIYSVTMEELPSSTYVVVFENSLPPLENPFGTVGDYEVTGWWQSEGLTLKKRHPRMIAQVCDTDGNVTMTSKLNTSVILIYLLQNSHDHLPRNLIT